MLNRFALFVAFPALIFAELTSPALEVPADWRFYAAHAAAFVAQLAVTWALARAARVDAASRGPTQLSAAYGNIAYLGIPFCASVLGEASSGLAALSAGVHVTFGLAIGPWLLVGGRGDGGRQLVDALGRVARLPLVWTPVIALAARLLPAEVVGATRALAAPIGTAAGPVALFLLGLYIGIEYRRLAGWDRGLVVGGIGKLVTYPALALATAVALGVPRGPQLQVIVLEAAMPTAITTFALSTELGVGAALAARAIVVTTLVSVATLALWAAVALGYCA